MRKKRAVVLTCCIRIRLPEIDCDSVAVLDQIAALSPIAPQPMTNNSAIELKSIIRASITEVSQRPSFFCEVYTNRHGMRNHTDDGAVGHIL
jgi:hypothetical protein